MTKDKEKVIVHQYREYYCDHCGKYIGRSDVEYDRLYKIWDSKIELKSLGLERKNIYCSRKCDEAAMAKVIEQIKEIGFVPIKNDN